ncbi:hypothetical protein J2X69_001241 [Algoriphagus sp. 4150]|uniref:DUF3037 domain-containing protein n=1 Tax=Algoriphagus sp. 4150 TaxID=2817756 RepID=UPI002858CABE|nr:DUF3037 domain-containing protein [Algoriphagus sp. 4150]MDR7128909.1 hypothetical protein [Algoriphagus sp. 4150]
MQEQHLYEYAVIRVVPRVEREEFINVGVVLCHWKRDFLGCKIHLNTDKLLALDPLADVEMIQLNLTSFEKICAGMASGGNIASMDFASRFRWLTAVRSSIIQTSRPHSGYAEDLQQTLQRLFEENVG